MDVKCSNCSKMVKAVCANCWRCDKCCDCPVKGKRIIDGFIGADKK